MADKKIAQKQAPVKQAPAGRPMPNRPMPNRPGPNRPMSPRQMPAKQATRIGLPSIKNTMLIVNNFFVNKHDRLRNRGIRNIVI